MTITSLTATRMTGTFSFTADETPGPGTTTTVTNGSFEITIPSGFTAVPAGNHGSAVAAEIGGSPWNGATVIGLGDVGTGVITLGGTTATSSFTLGTTTPVTVGSYTVGNGVTLQFTDLTTGNSWGSLTGVTGTVTFTSLADGRAAGTFSGVLVPIGVASGNLTITGGSFDVRVDAP